MGGCSPRHPGSQAPHLVCAAKVAQGIRISQQKDQQRASREGGLGARPGSSSGHPAHCERHSRTHISAGGWEPRRGGCGAGQPESCHPGPPGPLGTCGSHTGHASSLPGFLPDLLLHRGSRDTGNRLSGIHSFTSYWKQKETPLQGGA